MPHDGHLGLTPSLPCNADEGNEERICVLLLHDLHRARQCVGAPDSGVRQFVDIWNAIRRGW